MEFSYQSALILPLPSTLPQLHSEIQAVRIKRDKAYGRWMPHINLLFPFATPSSPPSSRYHEALEALTARLKAFPSFRLWFSSIGSFSQGKVQTVHLVPETDPPNALADLFALIVKAFPEYLSHQKRGMAFSPHLTIGQWPSSSSLDEIRSEISLSLSLSLSLHVDCLHIIARDGDAPFSMVSSLSLGYSDDVAVEVEEMNSDLLSLWEEKKKKVPHAKVYLPELSREEGGKESQIGKEIEEKEKEKEKEEEEEVSHKVKADTLNPNASEDVLVRIHIPSELYPRQTRRLVFICDTSGSMEGAPKNLTILAVESLEKELEFEIVNYSTKAMLHAGTAEALRKSWQCGSTYFRLAFQTMIEYLHSHRHAEIDFCFMTDGHPSDDPFSPSQKGKSLNDLKEAIQTYKKSEGMDVTVHSFGLGSNSNLNLLESLRTCGSKEGVLVYASSKSNSQVTAKADEENIMKELRTVMSFAGHSRQCVVVSHGREYPADFFPNEANDMMDTEIWMAEKPDTLKLLFPSAPGVTVRTIDILEIAYVPLDYESELCRLRRDLFSNTGQFKIVELEMRLNEIRTKIQNEVPRESRSEALDLYEEVERDLDEVRKLAAEKVGAGLVQSDLIGRFKALAFRGRLQKARRAKIMDQQTLKNAHLLRGIESQLKKYPMPSKEELNEIDLKFPDLCDDIYGDSLGDILASSHSNILVLGLQVERDEVVVDQPVCLSVTLCNTLVSWATIEKAADFQNRQGNASASGSFTFAEKTCLLKGINGEELNAGLPLYGNAHHYRRVRTLLPLLCGHFFLLSPTGYSYKQIPALFAVLARLHRQAKSDRSIMIVEHFRLVCAEIMRDDILLNRLKVPETLKPRNILKAFCGDVRSHQKSELPTVDVVIGCLLAAGPPLTPQPIDRIPTPIEMDGKVPSMMAMELMRRHLNSRMAKLATGGDCFHADVRRMVTGSDGIGAGCIVKIKNAPFFDDDGVFHPVEFTEYSPLPPTRLIDQQILKSLSFPPDAKSFLEQFGVSKIISLEQDQYESLLFPSLLLSAYSPSNDRYATLIEQGLAYIDPADGDAVDRLLHHVCEYFDRKRRERFEAAKRQQECEEHATYLMYSTNSIGDFCRAIRVMGVSRGKEIWTHIVAEIMGPNTYPLIPLGLDKLAILLSGSDPEGNEVISGGPWMAGPVYGHAIRFRLRGTPYYHIIEKLDESCLEHQYRASDVPNRHGHHQSYPLWIADPSNPSVKRLFRKWDN
jgi:2'-5' RNA ligase